MVKLQNFSVFQLSSLFGSSNFLDSLIKNIHTFDTFYKVVFKVKYIFISCLPKHVSFFKNIINPISPLSYVKPEKMVWKQSHCQFENTECHSLEQTKPLIFERAYFNQVIVLIFLNFFENMLKSMCAKPFRQGIGFHI